MSTVRRIFIDAHRDAWRLLLQQWPAILVITGVGLVTGVSEQIVRSLLHPDAARLLVDGLLEIAGLWVATPAMVALFRYLILDKTSDPSPLSRNAVTGTYFYAAAAISLMLTFAAVVYELKYAGSPSPLGKLAPAIGNLVVACIVLTRLVTYLPGVAVGRDGRSFGLAFLESKGRFLFIVATYVATLGPVFILNTALAAALQNVARWQASIILVLTGVPLLLLGTAVAALLYRHLQRAADIPAPPAAMGNPPTTSRRPRQTFGRLAYSAPDLNVASPTETPSGLTSRIRAAYVDLVNIAREMWPVLLILTAIYFVCAMAWFFAPTLVGTWVGRMIMRMLIFIGIAWFAAPFYVSLHRFIATGEVRWIPPFGNYDGAGRVYFGWAGMTVALWFMPLILGDVAEAFGRYGVLVELIGFVVILCVLPRMTTLLPAAALDPQSATWAQAMDDSRGRAWSFFASTTLGALPAIIALTLLGQAAGAKTIEPVPFFALAVPSLLVLQLIPLAIGTRLYLGATRRGPSIDRMQQVIRPR